MTRKIAPPRGAKRGGNSAPVAKVSHRLAQSEARFRSLLALSSDWYWEQDEDFRFTAMGGERLDKSRLDHSRIEKKTRWELRHAGVTDAQWARHRAVLEAHQPFSDFEFQRPDRDGRMRWISISGVPMFDAGGRFKGYRGVGTDIHERKENSAALAEARQRLEIALEGSRGCIWDGHATGEMYLSAGWMALLGEPPRETRTTMAELMARVHPDDLVRARPSMVLALKGAAPFYEAEIRVRTNDGGWRWILSRGKVVERGAGGRATRMSGTNTDITGLREAQEALRDSEARFRGLTTLSSDWYWEQDQDFRFTLMSGELLTRTGIDVAQHIGKTRWELAALNLDDTDWAEHRAGLERHELFRDFEMRRPDRDGRMHWVSISGEPVFDDAGRFTGYRGVGRDITERKLREAQILKLSSAIEQSPASVLITDAQGTIEYVNPEFERVTGYGAAEALGQNPRILKSGEVAPETYAAMWNALLAGCVWRGELVNRKKNGEIYWEDASIAAVRGSDGATTHYVGVKTDITARKTVERALAEREHELRQVLDSVPAMIARVNAGGRVLYHNLAYGRLYGAPENGLAGRRLSEFHHPKRYEEIEPNLRRAHRGERVYYEVRRDPATGREIDVAVSLVPNLAKDGAVHGYYAMLLDITERKRLEDELRALNEQLERRVAERTTELEHANRTLRESEGRFRAILEQAAVGVAVRAIDPREPRWVMINQKFCDMLGYSRDELFGLTSLDIAPPDERDITTDNNERLHRGEIANYMREKRYLRKDSSTFWALLSVSAIHGNDLHPAFLVAVIVDIDRQKRAETEIRKLNSELEERVRQRTAELAAAMNELESFSYSVSHDLRAPVRAATGFSRIVLKDYGAALPGEAHRLIERIAKAGESMGEMIDGLLDLSRIGRREVVRQDTDLSRLAREVWDEVALAAPERKVLFEVYDGVAADCDPILTRNVLQNLLGNAFKYTRDAPEARVEFGKIERSGEAVCYVRDNGAGFDMAYASKLFGAFQRLHRANEFEGTGIGLATVQRIVQRHGGRIWAEAAPGKGATFYFTLDPAPSA
jgi:PAS domain S-box-containing protein